jgi:hypothetical protein
MKTHLRKWLNLVALSTALPSLIAFQGCSKSNQNNVSKAAATTKTSLPLISLGDTMQSNQVKPSSSNGLPSSDSNTTPKAGGLNADDDEMLQIVRHYLSKNGKQPPSNIIIVSRSSGLWKFRVDKNLPTELDIFVDFKTKQIVKMLGE